MKRNSKFTIAVKVVLGFAAALMLSGAAAAQSAQVQGLITGRTGATMQVQGQDTETVTVILTAATQVEEVEGLLKARSKQSSVTALIPGLRVSVKGSNNTQSQIVATSVKFKGSDLKTAQDIQAGLAPTEQQVQATQQQLQATNQQVQATEQQVAQQQQNLQQQEQQLQAAQARSAANKAAIAAANKRFGELGDYNIMGEVTVLFGNGQVALESQYKPQLMQLAQQALTISGYVIQVQGYASKVGSAAFNQKLSTERANNVLQFLEQQANVPLTNVLAPGAMGTSQQVAPDSTAEGQAENRRVVVRILQNKGVAGN
jgi:outer membrane protein OmpA-like peptidoglycan-associated protein